MDETVPPVLVVDDERFFREQIRDALAAGSIDCVTATTGEEGLERAADSEVGVVLLDVGLPGLSGIEVLTRLLAQQPMLRVIIVSAHTEQDLVLEALRRGACDYLAKPLHEEELILAVQRARANFAVRARGARLRDRLGVLEEQLTRLTRPEVDEPPGVTLEQRAVDAVAEVLGASKTSLMMLGEDGRELRVVAATGREMSPDEMDVVPVGKGVAGSALAQNEAVLIADVAADDRFDASGSDRYRTGSLAVAPLGGDGGAFGVLCATDRQDDAPFGDEDLSLLRLLSLGLGPALEPQVRSRGSDGTTPDAAGDTSGADAELARRVCDALTTEIEPERLISAALRAVAQSIPAAPVSLYLLDPSGRELRLEGQCERAGHADHERIAADRGLTGSVCQTGHLVATDSPSRDPRFDPAVDAPQGAPARPFICVPVVLRKKTLGVLRVFPNEGVSASARTGEILTSAISAAVRNVLMYRSLLESVDEVARARREAHGATSE